MKAEVCIHFTNLAGRNVENFVTRGGYSTKAYTGSPPPLIYTISDTTGTPFVYLPLTNGSAFTYLG